MDATTVVWTIGFPLFLAFLGTAAATGFAMTNSESIGFVVAKACFILAAFDLVGFSIYWVVATKQQIPWNLILPTCAAVIAIPTLVLSLQWLENLEIKLSNRLFPSNIPMPTLPQLERHPEDTPPADALKILFGYNLAYAQQFPFTLLAMAGDAMIQIDKERGRRELVVTVLRIFDDRDNIIARLDHDGIWVENSTRNQRPDSSTLVVFDHTDTEVLRIVFLNPTTLYLTGIFRHPEVPVPLEITNYHTRIGGAFARLSVWGQSGISINRKRGFAF
jgi:hypothetical protein